MRLSIPHVAVVVETGEVTKEALNQLMHRALVASALKPGALELYDGATQRFIFLRERQIYAAAEVSGGHLVATSIRDFLLGAARMNFPSAARYELSTKILHSLLVVAQKKPALRVLTTLLELDEMLDKIEREGKSCVVSATRDDFVAILRYEKGKASAFCHDVTSPTPREGSFRDEFLVKVYTVAAERPATISLFEDFLVSYAPDAKSIPEQFQGRFEDVFLSKPPMLVVRFKDREIGRREIDRPRLRIGRTPDNDIVIDNLAVSRLHAMIEEDKGSYYVRDCDSLNGTMVGGQKVGRHKLEDADEIMIGKHTILFRVQSGHAVAEPDAIAGLDQTVIMKKRAAIPQPAPPAQREPKGPPRLVIPTGYGERVIEIAGDPLVIGSDLDADVHVDGLFVARRHAEIVREDGRFILRRLGRLRPVRVHGKAVREIELKDKDEIRIGNDSFVFHE